MNTNEEVVEELREALAPELHLLDRLGSGGMGDVFLARDPVLKRNVAVKVLAQQFGPSGPARERFSREAEAAAAVAHPNVVPIYRVGTLPRSELGYIVMAHVDGPTLRELVPAGTVASESEVRRIMAEVAAALAAAHARGVVHRDIKPANVLYDQPGGRFVVVDFGIASVLNRTADGTNPRLTMEGFPIGTPEYMSPEQSAGDPVNEKSDVYSLGCLCYELLTGRPPITGPTSAAVFFGHLSQTPPAISSLRSDLSPEFAALVMRCLQKNADERPDAEELTRALGLVRQATIEWPPPGLEALHREGARWIRVVGRFAVVLFLFVAIMGIHPAAARPCCADSPDRSPGWLLLKRLSMVTPIRFDDPDALAIWYFLLDASFFVLLAALVPVLIRTVTLARQLIGGQGSGYPLTVLARVAWDRHRDTGDLINLTGRYAQLARERRDRQLRRRALGSGALAGAAVFLIGTCLAWLSGWLDVGADATAGLLPFGELALIAVPAAAALGIYLVLEAIDFSQRWTPRRSSGRPSPLRKDVLGAWLSAAGVTTAATSGTKALVRGAGIVGVVVTVLTVVVAAYGLIAVFGASARFATDRAGVADWLSSHSGAQVAPSVVPLEERTALALVASVPLDGDVMGIILGGRIPVAERRLLLESVGPGFCLNPREVLFGVIPARLAERDRVARLAGLDTAGLGSRFDSSLLTNGGLLGLRRRARYCEQYFGNRATISPKPRE
jgi:hypothetical protein